MKVLDETRLDMLEHVGADSLDDLIEGWLRTGPHSAWHTIVAGRPVVESGLLVAPDLDEKLAAHAAAARRFQPR